MRFLQIIWLHIDPSLIPHWSHIDPTPITSLSQVLCTLFETYDDPTVDTRKLCHQHAHKQLMSWASLLIIYTDLKQNCGIKFLLCVPHATVEADTLHKLPITVKRCLHKACEVKYVIILKKKFIIYITYWSCVIMQFHWANQNGAFAGQTDQPKCSFLWTLAVWYVGLNTLHVVLTVIQGLSFSLTKHSMRYCTTIGKNTPIPIPCVWL